VNYLNLLTIIQNIDNIREYVRFINIKILKEKQKNNALTRFKYSIYHVTRKVVTVILLLCVCVCVCVFVMFSAADPH